MLKWTPTPEAENILTQLEKEFEDVYLYVIRRDQTNPENALTYVAKVDAELDSAQLRRIADLLDAANAANLPHRWTEEAATQTETE